MKDPLEMMERCHGRLAEEAERLRDVADREEAETIVAFFRRTLRRHFADEEESLFPRLGAEHAALVADLIADHRAHERLVAQLADAPDDAALVARWAEALRVHAEREERELLPLVAAMDPAVVAAMAAEMQARRGRGEGGGRGGGRGRG